MEDIVAFSHSLGPDHIIWSAAYQPSDVKLPILATTPIKIPSKPKRIKKIKETPIIKTVNIPTGEEAEIIEVVRNNLQTLLPDKKKIPLKFIKSQYTLLGENIKAGATKMELINTLIQLVGINK